MIYENYQSVLVRARNKFLGKYAKIFQTFGNLVQLTGMLYILCKNRSLVIFHLFRQWLNAKKSIGMGNTRQKILTEGIGTRWLSRVPTDK